MTSAGELPGEVQARLLRVLQDGELREFGSTAARPINVRLITATHRDLRKLEEPWEAACTYQALLSNCAPESTPWRSIVAYSAINSGVSRSHTT